MNLLDAALNAGSGGIFGLVGSLGTGLVSLFQAKNQFAHDEKMADLNIQLLAAQSAAAERIADQNFKTLLETQAGQAFTASQVGASTPSVPWIDGAIKLWRPLLTAALMALTFYFYQTGTLDLRDHITRAIVELTGMAVAWWWGSRQLEKFIAAKPPNTP